MVTIVVELRLHDGSSWARFEASHVWSYMTSTSVMNLYASGRVAALKIGTLLTAIE